MANKELKCSLHSCHTTWLNCFSKNDGTMWIEDKFSQTQVNYCPICGYEAIFKVELIV